MTDRIDRRRYPRLKLNRTVPVRPTHATRHFLPVHAKVSDISPGGLFLEAAPVFPIGSRVALAIRLDPQQQPYSIVGTVRHLNRGNRHGMGVEFGALSRKFLKKLKHYLRGRLVS